MDLLRSLLKSAMGNQQKATPDKSIFEHIAQMQDRIEAVVNHFVKFRMFTPREVLVPTVKMYFLEK